MELVTSNSNRLNLGLTAYSHNTNCNGVPVSVTNGWPSSGISAMPFFENHANYTTVMSANSPGIEINGMRLHGSNQLGQYGTHTNTITD